MTLLLASGSKTRAQILKKAKIGFKVVDHGVDEEELKISLNELSPKDISIQQVYMDTLGTEKEWVAVVNLNTKDENSYLQSELPYCKVRDYLIGAKVTVKAYIDNDGCCDGLRDYNKCIRKATCENKLTKLKDKLNKDYSKNVMLTGTQYVVTSSHDDARRRRLLIQNRRKGDCRL